MHTQLGPVGALFLALWLAAIVSCAPGQSGHQDERATRSGCEATQPAGDATMFTLGGQTLDGVQVGQVQTCGDERVGFIRLTPDSGTRVLTLGRNDQGGVDDCTPDAIDPETCPRVQAGSFARRVEEAL